jgi:uncharacterized protein (TIGR02596 family)
MKANPSHLPHRRGFTLIELMTVLTIMAILLTLVGPSLIQSLQDTSLGRAAALIQNNLKAAHQYALSLQNPVYVRFYSYIDPTIPNSTQQYRAIQLIESVPQPANPSSSTLVFLTPITTLPAPNIIIPNGLGSTGYSTLLTLTSATYSSRTPTTTPPIPGVSAYTYVQFLFLPNGQTNLSPPTSLWYVTVASSTQATTPVNFYTIQVDPLSGKITFFRP